jgi:low temperature requirement protein LtrA
MITHCDLTAGSGEVTASRAALRRLAGRLVLRPPARSEQQKDRHASWLELFFDLIFVLALSAVAGRLGNGPAPAATGVAVAFGLFTLVLWAWIGQVYYDTRYDPDDVTHRLVVLVAMAGAGAIALGVADAPQTPLLPVGYLLVRGVLLLLYLRVRPGSPAARQVTTIYLTGFGLGWLIWLGSLAAPVDIRPALWITALAIELATPWLGLRPLARNPVDTTHLPERIGQFTIILLGVTLTDLLRAVPAHPAPRVVATAAAAFVVPASIWWAYATFLTTRLALPRLRGGQPYSYLHIPFGAGLLFLGWSLGQAVRLVDAHQAALPGALRALIAGATAAWMLASLGLNRVSLGSFSVRRLAIAGCGIGSVCAVAAVFTDPITVVVLLAVAVAGYAVLVSQHIVTVQRGSIRP